MAQKWTKNKLLKQIKKHGPYVRYKEGTKRAAYVMITELWSMGFYVGRGDWFVLYENFDKYFSFEEECKYVER